MRQSRMLLAMRTATLAAIVCLAALVSGFVQSRAEGFSVAGIIAKLDRTERQIVEDTVKQQIPQLFADEGDRKIAATMISGFDSLAQGKLNDAIATVLAATADIYDFKGVLFERFPDGTYAGYFLRKADEYPEISKKLAKGLLNKNTDWHALSKEVMSDYAEKKYKAALAEGEKFWRDAINQIIDPPEILGKAGIDPIDLYLQAVDDWTVLVKRQKRDWNRDIIDCAYRSYQVNGAEGYLSIDLAQAPCDFLRSGSLLGRFTGFLGDKITSTAAVGGMGITRVQLIALMRRFEQDNPSISTSGRPGFAEWIEDEFEKMARQSNRDTGYNFVNSVDTTQQRFEQHLSTVLARIDKTYFQAIFDLLGEEEFKRRLTGDTGKDKGGNKDDGVAGEDTGGSSMSLATARAIAENSCKSKEIKEAIEVLADAGQGAAADAATARRKIIRTTWSLIIKGKKARQNGKMEEARQSFERARAVLQDLGNAGQACPEIVARIERGLNRIGKTEDALAKVDRAIKSCRVKTMANYASQLARAEKLTPAMAKARKKLDDALLTIEPFDISFSEMQALADRGQLGEAYKKAVAYARELRSAGLRRCKEYAQLRDFADLLKSNSDHVRAIRAAAKACDTEKLAALKKKTKGPAAKKIVALINSSIRKCAEPKPKSAKGKYAGTWVAIADYWGDSNPGDRRAANKRRVIVKYDTETTGTFSYRQDTGVEVHNWTGSWSMKTGSSRVRVRWNTGEVKTYDFLKLTTSHAILRTMTGSKKPRPFVIEYKRVN